MKQINDYLKTLIKGEHTLKVAFVDGEASTKFTIKDSKKEIENSTRNDTKTDSNIISTKNPKTGDVIQSYIGMMIFATLGIVFIAVIRSKRK